MKKDILIIDWLMLVGFFALILSRITGFTTPPVLQMGFMVLIGIHLIQHWKILALSLKRKKK